MYRVAFGFHNNPVRQTSLLYFSPEKRRVQGNETLYPM
jgi:hypothetical protein